MSNDFQRIESIVSEKRVKLHFFEPSQRKIWTVVGKSGEHWLDPDAEFCSCPGYYFGRLTGKLTCYHLESVYLAKKENKIETIIFSDEEYADFISGIISDL
jgi:predicted nucleic acid-binding Zn finger protein